MTEMKIRKRNKEEIKKSAKNVAHLDIYSFLLHFMSLDEVTEEKNWIETAAAATATVPIQY